MGAAAAVTETTGIVRAAGAGAATEASSNRSKQQQVQKNGSAPSILVQ